MISLLGVGTRAKQKVRADRGKGGKGTGGGKLLINSFHYPVAATEYSWFIDLVFIMRSLSLVCLIFSPISFSHNIDCSLF